MGKKRWLWGLCALLALGLCAGLVPAGLRRQTSLENLTPTRAHWEGVCEIWLCETFQPGRGTLLGWVQKAVAQLEKENRGLFYEIRVVAPDVAQGLLASGELPDGILAGGGVVQSGEALCEAGAQAGITPAYLAAASESGVVRGWPVAAGAYTVLFNKEVLAPLGLDETLSEADFARLAKTEKYKNEVVTRYPISFAKTAATCPAAALRDLYPALAEGDIAPQSPAREPKDAWADFVLDKKSAGYVCTQKEVFRIRQLLAGGSAFEWVGSSRACTYTDQLLCLYIPGNADAGCAQAAQLLGQFLQSEAHQLLLADYGAFSVRAGLALYEEGTLMHRMALGLADPAVPNMFTLASSYGQMTQSDLAGALSAARAHLSLCKKD